MEERYLTLAEAKELLEEANDKRGELNHEQGFALQHARSIARLPGKRARALVDQLMEVDEVTDIIAVTLVDIMPTHPDDVKAIYYKERFEVSEDTVKKIITIFEENV